MEWYLGRGGRAIGPVTFEALVGAARRGRLGRNDYVWQPGADRWERADDIPALWVPPLEPPPLIRQRRRFWITRTPWLQAAVAGLVICCAALLVTFSSLSRIDPNHARPIKKSCAFEDYLQGRCR
jgi:hypothetical protein